MKIRRLGPDLDWTFGQSQSNYVRNAYAVILDIKMRLREWYGDCFFALQNGIPWRERLSRHNQKELLDNDLITRIQGTDGVLNVMNFTSTTDGRRYRAQCNVYTEYSTEAVPINIDTENFING